MANNEESGINALIFDYLLKDASLAKVFQKKYNAVSRKNIFFFYFIAYKLIVEIKKKFAGTRE